MNLIINDEYVYIHDSQILTIKEILNNKGIDTKIFNIFLNKEDVVFSANDIDYFLIQIIKIYNQLVENVFQSFVNRILDEELEFDNLSPETSKKWDLVYNSFNIEKLSTIDLEYIIILLITTKEKFSPSVIDEELLKDFYYFKESITNLSLFQSHLSYKMSND